MTVRGACDPVRCVVRLPACGAAALVGCAVLVVPQRPPPAAAGPIAHAAQPPDYMTLTEMGVAQGSSWRAGDWYCEFLGCTGQYQLLTVWGEVRMFESVDALELAAPSPAHRALVDRFARASERYWNPYLNGYAPHPDDRFRRSAWWFAAACRLGALGVGAYLIA